MRNLLIILLISLPLFLSSQSISENYKSAVQHFINGNFDDAEPLFKSCIKKHQHQDSVRYYLGRIYLAKGNYNEAIDLFEDVVDNNPNSSAYRHWLAQSYGIKAQNTSVLKKPKFAKKMKKELLKAIELDAENVEARYSLSMYYLMAPGIMGGSIEKAKEQASKIRELDPIRGIIVKAEIHKHAENFDLAIQEYLNGIEMEEGNIVLYYNLATTYEQNKDYDKCIETYEKIIVIDSSRLDIYYSIGRIGALYNVQLEKAKASFEKYLLQEPKKNQPSLAWAHYRLGMVYEKMGESALAQSEYKQALDLDPDHKEAKKALKM
ncbi:MAG: hypothetical protein CL663_00935 [Bacteroidetes bacterium]|nr:hypothetical protein [Bacteroidota bacterium]